MKFRNFSLFGLLSIVTCIALAIALVMTSIKLMTTTDELASLRKRYELIELTNPEHIAIRRLPTTDSQKKRWAVKFPGSRSKLLYANWGRGIVSAIQKTNIGSSKSFELQIDPNTKQAVIEMWAMPNPDDPKFGTLHLSHGSGMSTVTINAEMTSLLIGKTIAVSQSIGDATVEKSANAPVTIFAIESNVPPKHSFCIWLDEPSKKLR